SVCSRRCGLMSLARKNSFYKCVIDEDSSSLDPEKIFEVSPVNPGLDEDGAGPLHHATAGGSLETIRFLANEGGPEELNACDDHGCTPLHWAVEKNQESICSLLLDLGANPNILNKALLAPLHMAITKGHNTLVELLLSYSVTNENLKGDLGNTPVMLACCSNNCEALRMLVSRGAKLCTQNKLGHYAIHTVAFAGAKEAMEVILKWGEEVGYNNECQINYLDKSKSSPLHLAVRGGNIEVIKLCILKGAKIDQKQCDKSTALHFACTQGAIEAVRLMVSSYSNVEEIINIRDGANQTPLHRATIFDHADLAEYLISKGADIDCVDCKGLSPLLVATSCGAWKTVAFLLSKGANMKTKDKEGRNFLHLATFQPKGLKNLPEQLLQDNAVKELLCDEDCEGCTPLHYACRLGIHDSVKNILGLNICPGRKSKDKKSALHFAAEYGRINTCHRLLETITDSKLLNEGDDSGLTPLHLASRGGHTKVVELLLRKGALFQSDYKGWTCLHHAAAEGYTQTMKILLSANIKLLDKADEEGNTALHFASKCGHAAAVKLLLERGASIVLNKNDASFLHEAVHHGRKDVANHLLDLCVRESDHDANSPDYHVRTVMCSDIFNATLQAMVQYNRIELLTHPVCNKYLEMKWLAYGSKVHLLNLAIYLLGLLPLTYLIVNLKPTQNMENGTSVTMVPISFHQVRANYFTDFSNAADWTTAISSLVFVIPIFFRVQTSWHWEAGALAILFAWVNFLLYLQRFEHFGIYVVMFGEIIKTLISIIVLFVFLLLAFGLSFYALMLHQVNFLSLIQTFVMMVGELNYQINVLEAYENNRLAFPVITYAVFVLFVLLMPILLMNLMIGLAVGDIAEVQRNASLKRIAMQIDLHTNLEEKLPYWFMKRVDKPSITIYPNRKCGKRTFMSYWSSGDVMEVRARLNTNAQHLTPLEHELHKQKQRLKEMSSTLEKQHNLMKLIIQKMEITSEADEYDGPEEFRGSRGPAHRSKWIPLMKAIKAGHK
uniref:Ion transport domain-containing protein n=1 Tax=Denticeps clupeoides TaxID=299321 RepID=A0AAY4ATT1_9TELE